MRTAVQALAALVWFVSALPAQNGGIFPFEYRKVELENGFRAYLIHAGAPGQIAYVTVMRTGSRDEWEAGRSGYAHFFEHMMFRGTEKHPDFDAVLTRIGADSNAFTNADMTVYHIVASRDSLETLVDLESDRFRNLKYGESEFRTEAGAVLGEFSQGRANPFSFLFEKLLDTAFEKHTYKHTTIGFEKDVRAMPEGYDYSLTFFERYYRPENAVLLLVGDFDFDTAESLIREHYGPWEAGYVEPRIQPEPEQEEAKETTVEFPGRTLPITAVAYKGPAWDPKDRIAVATELLGEVAFGENSDIYKKLVIQDQTVQAFGADFELQRDPGLAVVFAMAADLDKIEAARREIAAAVERFRASACDGEKLEDTKSAVRYGYLMGLETARDVAFSLLTPIVYTGRLEAINEYYETLASITPDDVLAAAQQVLVEDHRTVVTLVPEGGE